MHSDFKKRKLSLALLAVIAMTLPAAATPEWIAADATPQSTSQGVVIGAPGALISDWLEGTWDASDLNLKQMRNTHRDYKQFWQETKK